MLIYLEISLEPKWSLHKVPCFKTLSTDASLEYRFEHGFDSVSNEDKMQYANQ